MRVPVCPLGDLADYPLETLRQLSDQHLERAAELRRKLDTVVERGQAIENAIEDKEKADDHPGT